MGHGFELSKNRNKAEQIPEQIRNKNKQKGAKRSTKQPNHEKRKSPPKL